MGFTTTIPEDSIAKMRFISRRFAIGACALASIVSLVQLSFTLRLADLAGSREQGNSCNHEILHANTLYRHEASLHETPIVSPHIGHKTVLLTGGAGFIGSHVAEFLLKRGDTVIIIDELNDHYDVQIKMSNLDFLWRTYHEGGNLHIYKGDICDTELMEHIFVREKPRWVCHLAARAGVRPSVKDPFVYLHSNIEGTTRLLELSRINNVSNFVYASSSSVYALSKSEEFLETESVDHPVSPYAATKKATELLAYTYHHIYGLNTTGLRFFTVYGPRGRPVRSSALALISPLRKDMAPSLFIDRVSKGLPIERFGKGDTSRDYTYIDDIVAGVVRAIDRPYGYEVFNLGRGSTTNLNSFIQLIAQLVGRKAAIEVKPPQKGDVPFTRANIDKANKLLGYDPKISVYEGVQATVEWYNRSKRTNSVTKLEKKICFITSVYGSSADEADKIPDVRRAHSSLYENTTDFLFLAITNLEDLACPGWKRIVFKEPVRKFRSHIIQSRYAKFLGWKIPVVRDSCRAVFYADGVYLPKAEAGIWKNVTDEIIASDSGMIQPLHSRSHGPLHEIKRIVHGGKGTKEAGEVEAAWLKSQPGFKSNSTMYTNNHFGYDPENMWFQQATLRFWKLWAVNRGNWTFRDQPLWSFTLDLMRYKPMTLGSWPDNDVNYWEWKGKAGYNGHRYATPKY